MEISNFDLGSSVIAMENTPITFTWKELTIKIKGTEARNGFLGMGKRNATNEKRILDKGKYRINSYKRPLLIFFYSFYVIELIFKLLHSKFNLFFQL